VNFGPRGGRGVSSMKSSEGGRGRCGRQVSTGQAGWVIFLFFGTSLVRLVIPFGPSCSPGIQWGLLSLRIRFHTFTTCAFLFYY
jgi:hypothetical protein